MASNNNFVFFDELNENLKLSVFDNITNPKDFLRLIASSASKSVSKTYVQAKLGQFQKQGYHKLIHMLFHFTQECFDMEKKFLKDEAARAKHFELFLNGYANHAILQDDNDFKEYNYTFDSMLYDIAISLRDDATFYNTHNIYCMYAEIINKLRLRNELHNEAKDMLFKRMEEELIEHKLDIEFESGVHVSINISIGNQVDVTAPYIDIDASFNNVSKNQQYKTTYVISGEQEDYDDETDEIVSTWVNNDPMEWIVLFAKSLETSAGKKFILGNVKNINYKYNGEQFWAKAYMMLEVLPKLWSI